MAPTGGAGATPPPGTGRTTISDLLERLRTRGWRLTPQRRVVAQVLEGDHVHLSAETVHALATELLPEVSLATVYNTLNELVAMGELLEITVSGGRKRYDPNVTRHHQHLVCVQCGELRDVLPAGEASLGLPRATRPTATGWSMSTSCSGASAPAAGTRPHPPRTWAPRPLPAPDPAPRSRRHERASGAGSAGGEA